MKSIWALWGALSHLFIAGQMWPFPGPGQVAAGGGGGGVTQIVFGGTSSTVASGATAYGTASGVGPNNATDPLQVENIFLAGTITNFQVNPSANPASTSPVVTLIKNGDTTGAGMPSCSVALGSQVGCSSSTSVSLVDGDRLSVKVVNNGSTATAFVWSLKWVGSVTGISMVFGNGAPSASASNCIRLYGAQNTAAACNSTSQPIAAGSYTVQGLYARVATGAAIATGCQRLNFNKNNTTNSTYQIDFAAGGVAFNSDVTGDNQSFTSGDIIAVSQIPSNTAGNCAAGGGTASTERLIVTLAVFSSNNEFMAMVAGATTVTAGARFSWPSGTSNWLNSETSPKILSAGAFTPKTIAAKLNTAPSTGNWDMVVRKAATSDVFSCNVATSQTTCSQTGGTTSFAAGDPVLVKTQPNSGATPAPDVNITFSSTSP